MTAEPDHPSNAAAAERRPAAGEPANPREFLRLGNQDGLPGLVALVVVDAAEAATTLETIFGPAGPPPTLTFDADSGPARIYRGPWFGSSWGEVTIEGVLPEDPSDGRLAGLRILLGSRECYPKVCQEAPRLLAPPGLPRRLYSGADHDVASFPFQLRAYLQEHYGRPVVLAPSYQPGPRIAPKPTPGLAGTDTGPIPRDELAGLTPLEKVEHALESMGIRARKTESGQIVSRCPLHLGERDNFSVSETTEGGKLLIYCHRCTCEVGELVEALGLRTSDLFPSRDFRPAPHPHRRRSNVLDARFLDGVAKVSDEMALAWQEEADRYAWTLGSQDPENDGLLRARRLGLLDPGCCGVTLSPQDQPHYGRLLAERLGLPVEALTTPLHLGVRLVNRLKPDDGTWVDLGAAWTWPEYDARGRVVGIMRRFVDPSVSPRKRAIGGRRETGQLCARGLVHNLHEGDLAGPVIVVEGESDFCALAWKGHPAVGRPGSKGGIVEVARLLSGDPRDVVVMGENDRKADGTWPGDPAPYASGLARLLPGRSIKTVLPPEPFKDIREFIVSTDSTSDLEGSR
jgi:hypothetical protein